MTRAVPASIPALVTGASLGIGAEFARRLAARGPRGALANLNPARERAEAIAEELRGTGVRVLALCPGP